MKLSSIIFLFFASQTFAQQRIDSIINSKTQEFKSSNIEKFFFFETYCIGHIKMLKIGEVDCAIADSYIYAFWREDNMDYMQRLSNCKNPKIEINKNLVDLYLKNLDTIKSEKVERYKTRKDSVSANKTYSSVKEISHSCFTIFHFYAESVFIEKKFDEFYLTTDIKTPNINYKKNNNLKLVELAGLCDKIIEEKKEK